MQAKSILINEQQYLSCLLNNPPLIKEENFNYLINDVSRCVFDVLQKFYENDVSFNSTAITSECLKTNKDVTIEIISGLKDVVSKETKDFTHYRKRLISDFVKDKVGSDILKKVTGHLLSKGELDLDVVRKTIDELQWAIDTVSEKKHTASIVLRNT